MGFVLGMLLALSPLAQAELLGKGEDAPASAAARSGKEEAAKPAAHQAPRPLVDPSQANIVRQRIPPHIRIGQYCSFTVVRGPARSAEARRCSLQGRALLLGADCRCGRTPGKVTASGSEKSR